MIYMLPIITWDIYQISSEAPLTAVMLRGRIRKLCLEHERNVLVENTQDVEKGVRFAVPTGENISLISEYLMKIIPYIKIEMSKKGVPNPVLSKLQINLEERYTL